MIPSVEDVLSNIHHSSDALILEQKARARRFIDRLEIIDPYCILAGGAPRDWLLSRQARDFDFYYYSQAVGEVASKKQLDSLFGKDSFKLMQRSDKHKDEGENGYSKIPYISRVWEGEFEGMPVQLIQVISRNDTYKVVEDFDISICQVWYKNGRISPSGNFMFSVEQGVIFTTAKNDKYTNTKHINKIKERFEGDFIFMDFETVRNFANSMGKVVIPATDYKEKSKAIDFYNFNPCEEISFIK